ncbi:MAG: FtsW/RodA/SpoVE family cell cycle protein [Clostridia bacterium]|nr:FtsW/RodA/SpoVE family cell cycle protein [Clostridia bacterium]
MRIADGRPILVKSRPDTVFLVLTVILVLLGTVVLFSASSAYSETTGDNPFGTIRSHLIHLVLGAAVMIGVIVFASPALTRTVTPLFAVFGIALLLLVLAIGRADGIAKRWIFLPGNLSIQPSEIAKTALIVVCARISAGSVRDDSYNVIERPGKEHFLKTTFFPGIATVACAGLIAAEHHLSGMVISALIGVFMIFCAGGGMVWLLSLAGLGGIAVFVLTRTGYTSDRIESWLHRGADLMGKDWQTTQGLYAIGSGGLFGKGLGESQLKYGYVSEVTNDFIFTVVCEELGFFGAMAIMLLFAGLVLRGFWLGFRCRDRFASLIILGISFKIGIHALLNVLVVTGLAPNTGISLPFFSSGGSATIIQLFDAGLLLGLSRYCDP